LERINEHVDQSPTQEVFSMSGDENKLTGSDRSP